jgi:hypothetical protein
VREGGIELSADAREEERDGAWLDAALMTSATLSLPALPPWPYAPEPTRCREGDRLFRPRGACSDPEVPPLGPLRLLGRVRLLRETETERERVAASSAEVDDEVMRSSGTWWITVGPSLGSKMA